MPGFLLPAALGASGALSTIGGIAQVAAGGKQRKRNRTELERLQDLEGAGELGLGGEQERQLHDAVASPLAAASLEARREAERRSAAAGAAGFGARELTAIRQEDAARQAEGASAADLAVLQADEAEKARQQAEIEQRLAFQAAVQRDNTAAVFGGLTDAAGSVGELAGAPPATTNLLGGFGTNLEAPTRGRLIEAIEKDPDAVIAALLKQLGGA